MSLFYVCVIFSVLPALWTGRLIVAAEGTACGTQWYDVPLLSELGDGSLTDDAARPGRLLPPVRLAHSLPISLMAR